MALHKPPLEVPFIDLETGMVTEPWAKWLIINYRDKANRVEDGTENNIATLDSDGHPQDSSSSLGDVTDIVDNFAELESTKIIASDGDGALQEVDLSDWVTGTASKINVTDDGDGTVTLTIPSSPTFITPTIADLTNMNHAHISTATGGDYAWADMTLAATQSDAVTTHSLTDASETVDRSEIEGMLNALGTIINNLIDKLQTAKLMT